ncbi:MAG: LuxR family transcriptional regulator [Gemmatimonadota bacterium]|nr:LuxR family transcriptional regulator [Gemmatimonadota bacterium]
MDTRELTERAAQRIPLGPREMEVLEKLLDGETERAIGRALDISTHTVHSHARSLYLKFDVHSRLELFRTLVLNSG